MGCQLWGESCSGSAAQRWLGLLCSCAVGLGYTPCRGAGVHATPCLACRVEGEAYGRLGEPD